MTLATFINIVTSDLTDPHPGSFAKACRARASGNLAEYEIRRYVEETVGAEVRHRAWPKKRERQRPRVRRILCLLFGDAT